jgi:hypothetical protein
MLVSDMRQIDAYGIMLANHQLKRKAWMMHDGFWLKRQHTDCKAK